MVGCARSCLGDLRQSAELVVDDGRAATLSWGSELSAGSSTWAGCSSITSGDWASTSHDLGVFIMTVAQRLRRLSQEPVSRPVFGRRRRRPPRRVANSSRGRAVVMLASESGEKCRERVFTRRLWYRRGVSFVFRFFRFEQAANHAGLPFPRARRSGLFLDGFRPWAAARMSTSFLGGQG